MIRVVLVGAAGRMARAFDAAAAGARDLEIKARVDRAENLGAGAGVWTSDLPAAVAPGDVVVEFAGPEGAVAAARACAERGAALVSGATGLGAAEQAELEAASKRVAVLHAANFSLGLAALRRILDTALRTVPGSWDIEIVERHHRQKADSPSGTALVLARDAAKRRGVDERSFRHGREGRVGARPAGEIGLHSIRGGSWVGDHQVLLAGDGESIELRHVVQDRAAFAHGALAAVRFVASAAPGRYAIEDCLGPGN